MIELNITVFQSCAGIHVLRTKLFFSSGESSRVFSKILALFSFLTCSFTFNWLSLAILLFRANLLAFSVPKMSSSSPSLLLKMGYGMRTAPRARALSPNPQFEVMTIKRMVNAQNQVNLILSLCCGWKLV